MVKKKNTKTGMDLVLDLVKDNAVRPPKYGIGGIRGTDPVRRLSKKEETAMLARLIAILEEPPVVLTCQHCEAKADLICVHCGVTATRRPPIPFDLQTWALKKTLDKTLFRLRRMEQTIIRDRTLANESEKNRHDAHLYKCELDTLRRELKRRATEIPISEKTTEAPVVAEAPPGLPPAYIVVSEPIPAPAACLPWWKRWWK